MHLESEDIIDQPADVIYPLVRDNMSKLVPYLQNVEKIEPIEREELEGGPRIVCRWHPKVEIPSVAKKFVKPETFSWIDHATWDDEHYKVDFYHEPYAAKDLFTVKGTNSFGPWEQDPTKTRLYVCCDVEIYPERLPGMPSFVAKRLRPTIESMIKKMIQPNLTSLGKGLVRYFETQQTQ